MDETKKISILMGIYNCESTLREAIDSIIDQTYTNWKFIICDDGSSDNTYCIADQYQKKYPDKIILLKNDLNRGLNATLNRCLNVAKGKYIARMDGDDRCSKFRFERELSVFRENPDDRWQPRSNGV